MVNKRVNMSEAQDAKHAISKLPLDKFTHTPTPWVSTGQVIRYLSETGAILADCEFFGVQGKANAEYIVRAVNEYDHLKKSNQTLFERTQNLEKRVNALKDSHEKLIKFIDFLISNGELLICDVPQDILDMLNIQAEG